MKFKKGQEIEVRFDRPRFKKFEVSEDFDSEDERFKLYDKQLNQKFKPLKKMCKIRNKDLEMEENWKLIKEKIKHSTIGRFPWKAVLGRTLTNTIQTYNLKGLTSEETYLTIIESKKFIEMMNQLPIKEQNKLKDKVKISVSARFGEKNSSDKLEERMK